MYGNEQGTADQLASVYANDTTHVRPQSHSTSTLPANKSSVLHHIIAIKKE